MRIEVVRWVCEGVVVKFVCENRGGEGEVDV